jgi:NarL family two-component system response regulator LiaR
MNEVNGSQGNQIRILLINEIQLISNVIAASLADEPDIHIAECVSTVEEGLRIIQEQKIDVVLVSTRLPNRGALQFTKNVTRANPATKVLVFGLTEDKKHVIQFVEAGASGIVSKDDSINELLDTIRAANDDRAILSSEIASALMHRLSEVTRLLMDCSDSYPDEANLTPRELEVLEMIGEKMSNQQIADELIIEVGTVKNHVHNILAKLGVHSRRDARAYLAFIND